MAIETAKLMRWIDKDIKLIASGSSNYDADWNKWNRTILDEMYNYIDYISLHHYSHNTSDYYTYLTNTIEVENYIRIVEQQIKEAKMKNRSSKDVFIAFDEWNAWTRTFGGTDNTLSEIYDLQDALIVAQYLNIFLRTCDIVKMANMAQLVNVIAPMRVDNDKLWKQTTYYPLYLFANNCRGKALDIYIKSPAYSTDKYKEVPYLDVSSTYEPSRNEVVINVVNRNKDKAITADILSQTGSFDKKATANIVSGANINITNSVNEQNVDIKKEEIKTSGEKITYSFAPRSFTQIIVKVK
jgi:alpha-N-arabinofuranosidase